jgi:hypothetical protein
MSLKGELTDLSLAELIEFFCNQRKTGRLTVSYPHAPAYFYLQSGSVVHASVGSLRGIEAVYYALTQSNASFNFSTAYEAPDQTINQPWTSVVLEGLRRMDEGINPRSPFSENGEPLEEEQTTVNSPDAPVVSPVAAQPPIIQSESEDLQHRVEPAPVVHSKPVVPAHPVQQPPAMQYAASEKIVKHEAFVKPKDEVLVEKPAPSIARPVVSEAFLSSTQSASKFSSGPWKFAAVFAALVLIIAGIAVPWGLRVRGKAARAAEQQAPPVTESAAQTQPAAATETSETASTSDVPAGQSADDASAAPATSDAADAARREREARAREEARLRAKAAESNGSAPNTSTQPAPAASSASASQPAGGPKKAVVQVTYDENGRVTGASGSDPTALRIARQKRFPPGKAGSATLTIPIN